MRVLVLVTLLLVPTLTGCIRKQAASPALPLVSVTTGSSVHTSGAVMQSDGSLLLSYTCIDGAPVNIQYSSSGQTPSSNTQTNTIASLIEQILASAIAFALQNLW